MNHVVLAFDTTGAGAGQREAVIAVVGVVIMAALAVIGVLLAVIRRGRPLRWFGFAVLAIVATVLVLSVT